MPMSFQSSVAVPGGASYSAPLLDFSDVGNWGKNFIAGSQAKQQQGITDQQKQLNDQRIADEKRKADIAQTFSGGLPRDSQGNIDYQRAVAMLAQKGDISSLWNGADAMLSQSASKMSPMLSGGGQPASPQVAPQQPVAPASNTVRGDAGSGTIASIVTDKLPGQDATTGQTIAKVAQTMGLDPNANLTPGQIRRAQGLVQKYAPADAGGGGGDLPPSANAIAPKPPASSALPSAAAAQPAPQGAPGAPQPAAPTGAPQQPQPVPPPAQAAPQQPQQPQQPQGGPIVPQVPLPKGFTDPQQAILALRSEAARMSANPKAIGQVRELENWAQRIEQSLQPLSVGPNTTLVNPRDGKPLYQGPGAAAIANSAGSPTLDADAERYRQSGQLPPNMGRGMQGSAEAKAIRARAAELEIDNGGDPSQWSDKWQAFKAKGVGLTTAERTKAGREENLNLILRAADAAIPAALEASKNLPRGSYVPLNRLIQKGEVMSSDPRLVEFGMANLQLAEHWARAMNPTGVMRESDRDKALHFLDTAYSGNTYERAVMQLQKQITRERDAVRGGGSILKDGKSPDPGQEPQTTPAGVSWSVVK